MDIKQNRNEGVFESTSLSLLKEIVVGLFAGILVFGGHAVVFTGILYTLGGIWLYATPFFLTVFLFFVTKRALLTFFLTGWFIVVVVLLYAYLGDNQLFFAPLALLETLGLHIIPLTVGIWLYRRGRLRL